MSDSAPQLGEPFRDTPAEESSVAALLVRTPVQIALSILRTPQTPEADSTKLEAMQRQGLAECLAVYDAHLRLPGRSPCSLLIARGLDADTDRRCLDAFNRTRIRLPEAAWLREMQLRFWRDETAPLSLELAQVVARAVAEHLRNEALPNPIVEAVLSKLSQTPDLLKRSVKDKRR
ncbi:hypothetical protein [Tahibacter soli]|uniref:Uncharacterized protein n=1 Tax=Tahibacter soli TaxID=2983605 RepID=A0A9X3YN39_9GAMM|nr:hypothetical protein [Tahibacter soli]MDC8015426.1 hypothetical protein [Tahibacter soli]